MATKKTKQTDFIEITNLDDIPTPPKTTKKNERDDMEARYNFVLDKLRPTLAEIHDLEEQNQFLEKPRKLKSNYKIKVELADIMSELPTNKRYIFEVPKYTSKVMNSAFVWFKKLITQIIKKSLTTYVPSKQDFCTFAGITVAQFNYGLTMQDPDVKDVFSEVNNYIFDLNASSGEDGIKNNMMVTKRLSATNVGQGIKFTDTATLPSPTTNNILVAPNTMMQQLDKILGETNEIDVTGENDD